MLDIEKQQTADDPARRSVGSESRELAASFLRTPASSAPRPAPALDPEEATSWAEMLSTFVVRSSSTLFFIYDSAVARSVYSQLAMLRALAYGPVATAGVRTALARSLHALHAALLEFLPCAAGLGWSPCPEHPDLAELLNELHGVVKLWRDDAPDAREWLAKTLHKLMWVAALSGNTAELIRLNEEIHGVCDEKAVWSDSFVDTYTRATFETLEAVGPGSELSAVLLHRLRGVCNERGVSLRYQALLGLAITRSTPSSQIAPLVPELQELLLMIVSYTDFGDNLPSRQ